MDRRDRQADARSERMRRMLTLPPSGPAERRGRKSGLVWTKRCPGCGEPVVIDPRDIHVVGGTRVLACWACRAQVPVRLADTFRPPPEGADLDLLPQRVAEAGRVRGSSIRGTAAPGDGVRGDSVRGGRLRGLGLRSRRAEVDLTDAGPVVRKQPADTAPGGDAPRWERRR